MAFIKAHKMSIFRKVALSLWGPGGDPSVYGFLEVDVTEVDIQGSPMTVVIKALAETMRTHKELNSLLRMGRLYYRKHVNISVMVNITDHDRNDLSFATLEDVDKMSLEQIEKSLSKDYQLIRKRKDPRLGFAWRMLNFMPWFMIRLFLRSYSFITHDLNISLNFIKLPKTPFGAVIVTNVGSLGIKKALVPLVPITRAAMLVSIGEISKEARVINDKIEIRNIMHLGCTFDHRFFDGSHAAKMIRDFENHIISGAKATGPA